MNAMLHDEQAEKFVLGALLVSEECYYSIADRLKPELFYDSKMARLAGIVIQLYANDSNVNIVTVTQYLLSNPKQGDPEPWEIAEYSSSAVLSAFEDSFRVIESLYVRRRYFSLGVKLMDYGTNLTMRTEDVEKEIQSVLGDGDTKKKRVKSLRDANIELKENVLHNYDGTSDTMIPTGFYEIDRRGGLQTGDFDVIAAESSMGKTSLLICMMVNAAKKGVPCMIYSMEMMSSQLAARIVSPIARISSGVIQYRKLSNGQMNDLSDAISQTDALPIYFDDESTISIDSIISSIRLWVRRLKIKLIGIDYLQILSSVGNISNQEQFLGGVCRRLKNLAKELQVCIIALSQLSRNTSDPKPTLGRLRASGQITEAADVVALIWRPSEYGKGYDDFPSVPSANTAELIIGKGRNIGKFNFIVGFDRERTYFYNYEREIEPQQTSSNEEETYPFSEPKVGELPF